MKGIYPALLTPFDEQGNIDTQAIKNLVTYLVTKVGIDGLFVGGSSGETFKLSTEEKKAVFVTVAETVKELGYRVPKVGKTVVTKDHAPDDIPLLAQIGSLDVNEMIELGRHAESLGYTALSAVVPFYYPLGKQEIYDFFATMAGQFECGLIVYYFPGFTGVQFDLDYFVELLSLPGIVGVKFTDKDLFLLERLISKVPEKLFYMGWDEMLLSSLVVGVDGAIGSTYNIHCHLARKAVEHVKNGKIDEAREMQRRINAISEVAGPMGELASLKVILEHLGVSVGYTKFPMRRLTGEEAQKVIKVAEENL